MVFIKIIFFTCNGFTEQYIVSNLGHNVRIDNAGCARDAARVARWQECASHGRGRSWKPGISICMS